MSAVLAAEAARRWRPSALIVASFALHGVALAWMIADFHAWIAAVAAIAMNHVVLGAIGMWPRSRLLGANLTRPPEEAGRAITTGAARARSDRRCG